ncbi:hypothetical protein BDP27DRAFT_296340 [Rhodocollybia butyracea]|uniref:Uncharacterized protein n=1 Tax=Rhodocollybia butyracea TaxID=206335 RepID=A0A9P5PAY5_9AGAR|nr:hypothetical protein BDP27DRAFT_296340 [Rhodocollybia butyracea]
MSVAPQHSTYICIHRNGSITELIGPFTVCDTSSFPGAHSLHCLLRLKTYIYILFCSGICLSLGHWLHPISRICCLLHIYVLLSHVCTIACQPTVSMNLCGITFWFSFIDAMSFWASLMRSPSKSNGSNLLTQKKSLCWSEYVV